MILTKALPAVGATGRTLVFMLGSVDGVSRARLCRFTDSLGGRALIASYVMKRFVALYSVHG